MMNYDQFLEQVQKDLEVRFANQKEGKYSQVRIGIQEVDKLQGESYRGLSFTVGDSQVKGSLNLRAAHQIFENGYPYEDLLSQIEKSVKREVDRTPKFPVEDLKDYSKMKSSLMMQLIPQKGNEDILTKIPHQQVEDPGVREYASRSFLYDPQNNHAHFWLIMSFIKNKNNKLARNALENAGNLLSGEDYGEMLIHLKKMAPEFVRENQS